MDVTTDNERLTPYYFFVRHPEGVEDEALLATMRTFADDLEARVRAFTDRAFKIDRDRNLTDMGRYAARASAAKEVGTAIMAAAAVRLDPLRRKIEAEERALLGPAFRHAIPSGSNPDDWRAAEAEARVMVRELEEFERDALYLRAAERGDRQTVRAYELAPNVAPLVTEEQIAAAAEAFAKAVEPARYQGLEDARRTADVIEGNLQRALEELQKQGGARVHEGDGFIHLDEPAA